jgi:asparaginyl-tRNA synthetase
MYIKNLQEFKDKETTLKGWIYNLRSSGKIMFLQLRDGTGFVQCILSKDDIGDDKWNTAQKITIESSVEITGLVVEHPKQPGVFELQVKDFKIHQIAEEYPISKKEHGPEFLLDNRHLWLRSKKQWAIQRIRDEIIQATYDFFHKENFIKIDSPILTPNACEGTTTLFEVEYFDLGKAYLSQTGQLYIEAAIMSHGRVFDFGPTFRAEKSKTRRHLTEFWMMDAEMAFCDHECNMKMQENLIVYIISKVLENKKPELEILERDISKLEKIKAPFDRMTHGEAVKKLQALGSKITENDDLGAEDETLLTKDSDVPIFVEKWPKDIKAFYMKEYKEDPKLVLCSDLIATEGHGELIGGSQREDDYDILKSRIIKEKLPLKEFEWYLDLRKYGSVPHSGFGYGLERLTGWISGAHHIRETIPFPRLINRIRP